MLATDVHEDPLGDLRVNLVEQAVALQCTEESGLAPVRDHLPIPAQVVPTTVLGVQTEDKLLVVLEAAVPAQGAGRMDPRL